MEHRKRQSNDNHKSVFQIDVSKYSVTLLSDTVNTRTDLGGVAEEVLTYSLVNNASKIDLVLTFMNGNFTLFQLSVIEGISAFTPIYTRRPPTDTLQASRDILTRYESVENNSYLTQMSQAPALANELQPSQVSGNIKLKTTTSGDNAQYVLLYTENNIDFEAKSLQMTFANGVLTSLSDDWSLYSIGSTQMTVTQDQAIQMAKNAAKTFTWNSSGVQVSSSAYFKIPSQTVFFAKPRSDCSLFPYWYITLYLDKTYPGGVNSIAVGIWADTGQVANIQALSS